MEAGTVQNPVEVLRQQWLGTYQSKLARFSNLNIP